MNARQRTVSILLTYSGALPADIRLLSEREFGWYTRLGSKVTRRDQYSHAIVTPATTLLLEVRHSAI